MSLSILQEQCIYTSCYCEENVWQICKHVMEKFPTQLEECYAVFISNEKQAIPLWSQKTSNDEQGLVIWDYHVIFIHKLKENTSVYDLDSRLSFPCKFEEYQRRALLSDDDILPQFHRYFRVVPAEKFLSTFASDRTHMIKDGAWIKPPPDYPPICTATCQNNLNAFIDMKNKNTPGQVLNCHEFIRQFS